MMYEEAVRVVDAFISEIDNPTGDDGGESARELLALLGYNGTDLSALIDRMIPLFVEKLKNTGFVPLSEEWWEAVVGTCIADTSIALGDPGFIERWENEK